jgi:hypothetical protein
LAKSVKSKKRQQIFKPLCQLGLEWKVRQAGNKMQEGIRGMGKFQEEAKKEAIALWALGQVFGKEGEECELISTRRRRKSKRPSRLPLNPNL